MQNIDILQAGHEKYRYKISLLIANL